MTTSDDSETVRTVLRELIEAGRSDEALDAAIALLSQLRDQNTDLRVRLAALRRQHKFERIHTDHPHFSWLRPMPVSRRRAKRR